MREVSLAKKKKRVSGWHIIVETVVIVIIAAQAINLAGCQEQLEGGRLYIFSGPPAPAGETYSYLWMVTNGTPQTSTDASFEWGAPTVGEPTEVVVTLEVKSSNSICSNRSELELLIMPPQPQPGELASISLKKDCIFTPPVRVGDSITYIYNVTNSGNVPLTDVNLTDMQNWGPDCKPVYVRGDNGNGPLDPRSTLDPGESWFYECKYTVPDPSDYLLSTMSVGSEEEAIVQKLIDLKGLLEIKMDSLKANRQRFNTAVSTLNIDHKLVNYTLYNYTNKITGESLSRRIDPTGKIIRTDYSDPVTHAALTSEYNPDRSLKSDAISLPDNKEYMKIEYNRSTGYRTYEINDYNILAGLKLLVDNFGNIVDKKHNKLPAIQSPPEEKFILKNTASVTANDPYGAPVSDMDSFSLEIYKQLPILTIAKKADPDPVIPGGTINYTITYQNLGKETAHNVIVKEKYNQNVIFQSANPIPDPGTTNTWSIGDLPGGESGIIKIVARVSPDVGAGSSIMNVADITSKENATDRAMINTTVKGIGLNITKSASCCCVKAGSTLSYTINYRNDGSDVQTNVTIDDYLDPNVESPTFNPLPTDSSGRHYWWNVGNLNPGDTGKISIDIQVKTTAPDSIYNNYRMKSDQAKLKNASLETAVVSSLWIRKTADKDACSPGDNITYTILFGNEEISKSALNVNVTDILPDVELISVSPATTDPQSGNMLKWHYDELKPLENRTIIIIVHIPKRPELSFTEESSVKGEGYVYVHKKLSTVEEKPALVNKAEINGTYPGMSHPDIASSTATVTIAGAAGTELATYEHGSGYYKEEELSSLRSKNHSVALNKDISAQHKNTVFSLPAGRSINYQSLWYDRTAAKNHVLNDAVTENYLYMNSLDKKSSFRADMNQTVYRSESDFSGGIARVNYRKYAPNSTSTVREISENYHGSFRLAESVDSYGESTKYQKSANGNGFVSSDERSFKPVSSKRSSLLQRSYEYGSGYYKSDGSIQLTSLTKSVMAAYAPANLAAGTINVSYGSLWNEGMITRDLENKLILSERLRSASYINKDAWMDTSSLSFIGEFNGTMDLRAVMNPRGKETKQIEIDQSFIGSYQISTAITAYSILKYNYPHVSITKEAVKEDESTILFLINITNDGNGILKPLYVTDLLPPGLTFIDSSLRPEISGRIINWTVPSLDIGRRFTIKLRTGIENDRRPYTNIATVTAHYNGHALTATNFTSFTPYYLPCCLGRYPKEAAYLAKVFNTSAFNTSVVQGQWGEWSPSPCFNVTSEGLDCFKAIDDYYNDLEKSQSDCCAASSYEVP